MEPIELDIIAKTEMNDGHCFMGLTQQNDLLRPIYTVQENACCWNRDAFQVYCQYQFYPRFYPPDCYTQYPHKNEDTLVYMDPVEYMDHSYNYYNRLKCQARPIWKIEEVFPLVDDAFVEVGENCPSVMVVKCPQYCLDLYWTQNSGKQRLQISDDDVTYDFRMTGLVYNTPDPESEDEALVLLGLGRPWDGDGYCDPARCYVLVLNIYT